MAPPPEYAGSGGWALRGAPPQRALLAPCQRAGGGARAGRGCPNGSGMPEQVGHDGRVGMPERVGHDGGGDLSLAT